MLKKIIIIFLIPFGLMSQSKFEVSCINDLLVTSYEIGLQQVGTIEKSNRNDGDVLKYLYSVGLTAGNPYCAAGQYFCFAEAVRKLNLTTQTIPIPRTGLANAIFDYCKNTGKKVNYVAAKHDLIIWRRGSTPFGHIERIIDVQKKGNVRTLAFNVSDINGIEGVFVKKRNIHHPIRRLKIRGLIGFKGSI